MGRPKGHTPKNLGKIGRRKPTKNPIPVIVDLFKLMDEDPRSYDEIATASKAHKVTIVSWRSGASIANLRTLDAVARALGGRLTVIKE